MSLVHKLRGYYRNDRKIGKNTLSYIPKKRYKCGFFSSVSVNYANISKITLKNKFSLLRVAKFKKYNTNFC